MRFETSQNMKLGQQMKLAPRMIQSMEILQLPTLALEERIEQELESNIALEISEPDGSGDEASDGSAQDDGPREERPIEIDESGMGDFERLDSMESSYQEAFENEYSAAALFSPEDRHVGSFSPSRMAGERDGKQDAMANAAARGASFQDQLLEQWRLSDVEDERLLALGALLIAFLDEDGFLRVELAEVADQAPQNLAPVTEEELTRALKVVQYTLDPAGIGARSLSECLLLQIDRMEEVEDHEALVDARTLVEDHLDDLLHNRLPRIAEASGLDLERIKQSIAWLRRLSPAPGLRLVDRSAPQIVPDAIVQFDEEDNRYIAFLNDNRLPNLRINEEYARMVRQREVERSTREFVKRNLTNAQWLLDAIAQRNHTLQRVLNVVVDAQQEFFDLGPQALRPLAMTQVAEQLGIHVATVSRAVAGKHLQTPRGVVALRKLFTGGAQTESGEDVSWDAIRAALSDIIDAEDKTKPLSDEALVEELRKRGIEIARRTVAKYRAQMDVPSARMRRQY